MDLSPSSLAEKIQECEQAVQRSLAACTPSHHAQEPDTVPTLPFHYLQEALRVNTPSIFTTYLQWRHAQEVGGEQGKEPIHQALSCISQVLIQEFPDYEQVVNDFIDASSHLLRDVEQPGPEFPPSGNPLGSLAQEYLQALLQSDRRQAGELIHQAVDRGTSIRDIYLHVFQTSQYEIGRLWQMNKATVAQEHFCTAATQLIMSQLYEHIFAMERRGRSLVATCVGGELHELGMRMVADFFEMDGWDTVYLGAGTSTKNILQTVDDRQPQIVGISSTMTSHVRRVENLVAAIRTRFGPKVKILVGGYPFRTTDLWQQVGADAHGRNAQEAVNAANAFFDPAGSESS